MVDTKLYIVFVLAMASVHWFTYLLPDALYWIFLFDSHPPNFPYSMPDVQKPDDLSVALIKSATWVAMQITFGAIGSVQIDDFPRSRSFVLMVVPALAMTGVWLEFYSYASDYVVVQNVCVAISGFGTWAWGCFMFRGANQDSQS